MKYLYLTIELLTAIATACSKEPTPEEVIRSNIETELKKTLYRSN